MKSIATLTLAVFLCASMAFAGSVRGEYIEARNADVLVGACFANSEGGIVGDLAVMGWKISKGEFEGVNLDGLSVVAVVRAKSTLGSIDTEAYPVKSVMILDEKANAEQRLALRAFAQKMSGDLLNDVVRVEYAPIEFALEGDNVHSATAKMTAGTLATIQTRAARKGDGSCAHEEVWYLPLSKVDHYMPAYTLAHSFKGKGLDSTWSSPHKLSAFVASFQLND
jgi:hypothetical protein